MSLHFRAENNSFHLEFGSPIRRQPLSSSDDVEVSEIDEGTCIPGEYCQQLWDAYGLGRLRNEISGQVYETTPWGEVYMYQPIDYIQLMNTVCEYEAQGLELTTKGAYAINSTFVQRRNELLMVNNASFQFVGFNAPQLLSLAAESQGLEKVDLLMSSAADLDLRVARVWAFRDGYDWRPPSYRQQAFAALQISPGVYNETTFRALDYIIASASRSGVYLTLTLTNWHRDYGGMEMYVKWVKGSSNLTGWSVYDYYTDERVRLLYKANLCSIVNRRNHITGLLYRDDPAIFAWDLVNEPRCSACPGATLGDTLQNWAAEMSSFMKSIDPHHLVTLSSEGYYGESTHSMMLVNPGLWAVCEGMDFARLYSIPTLDYAVAHLYLQMKTWDDVARQECDIPCALHWSRKWIEAHINYTDEVLHKPFVLEEFGVPKVDGSKHELFRLVYDTLTAAAKAGHANVAGSNFWAAAVGSEPDWDGYYLYLDGSLPAETPIGGSLSETEQSYWEKLEEMRETFRRKPQAESCYDHVKRHYAYLLDHAADDAENEYYKSTIDIVVQAVNQWHQSKP